VMIKNVLRISVPAVIALVSAFLVGTINVSFIGHLGNPAMVAGVGFGEGYINIMCVAVILGLNNALSFFIP
jgi:Na+-driven multidrug efflux pump